MAAIDRIPSRAPTPSHGADMLSQECDAKEWASKIDARLAMHPCFEALDEGDVFDVRQFCNVDLANIVETRIGTSIDPNELEGGERESWLERTLEPGESIDTPFVLGRRCFWLRDQAGRIGTIAYTVLPYRMVPTIEVSSLYITRERRSCGWGRSMLLALRDAAYAAGIVKVELTTAWCSQRALRFYCANGLWLESWKRDLRLGFARARPAWRLEIEGGRARFLVGEPEEALIVAERRGELLHWYETASLHEESDDLRLYAPSTCALALAVAGWPLITSQAVWQEQLEWGCADLGGPDELAVRIQAFEIRASKKRWRSDTPRIPGLKYPRARS
jgi:GNAT superfamily N-acetyltransferase